MKKRHRKILGGYLRVTADALELRDWTIVLEHGPADDGCDANVVLTYGRKMAHIRVSQDFLDFAPERQRQTIVHELVHCHLEPATNMVRGDLEDHLGKPADRIFWDGYRRQIEYAVDALADALAKHLPTIDWDQA